MVKMAGEKRCAIEWIDEHTTRLFDFKQRVWNYTEPG